MPIRLRHQLIENQKPNKNQRIGRQSQNKNARTAVVNYDLICLQTQPLLTIYTLSYERNLTCQANTSN